MIGSGCFGRTIDFFPTRSYDLPYGDLQSPPPVSRSSPDIFGIWEAGVEVDERSLFGRGEDIGFGVFRSQ